MKNKPPVAKVFELEDFISALKLKPKIFVFDCISAAESRRQLHKIINLLKTCSSKRIKILKGKIAK